MPGNNDDCILGKNDKILNTENLNLFPISQLIENIDKSNFELENKNFKEKKKISVFDKLLKIKKKKILRNFDFEKNFLSLNINVRNEKKRLLEIFNFLENELTCLKNLNFLNTKKKISIFDLEIINTLVPNFFLFKFDNFENDKKLFIEKNILIKKSHNTLIFRRDTFTTNLKKQIEKFFLLKKNLDEIYKFFEIQNILKIKKLEKEEEILETENPKIFGNLLQKKNLINSYILKKENFVPKKKKIENLNFFKNSRYLIKEIINLLYIIYTLKKVKNMFLNELLDFLGEKTKLSKNSKNEIYLIIKFLMKIVPDFIKEVFTDFGTVVRIDNGFDCKDVINKVFEFLK